MEFGRFSLRERDEFGRIARGKSRVMKWGSEEREASYVGREIVWKWMISGMGYGDGSGCETETRGRWEEGNGGGGGGGSRKLWGNREVEEGKGEEV